MKYLVAKTKNIVHFVLLHIFGIVTLVTHGTHIRSGKTVHSSMSRDNAKCDAHARTFS